jgi:hypothetical protein
VADNPGYFKSEDSRRGKKPRGTQHHRTKFLEALKAQSETEEGFIQKILEQAKEGSSTALTICATRLWKESRPTLDSYVLPESSSQEETIQNIIEAMKIGAVSPDWANAAMSVLKGATELVEVKEILQKLKELEGK